MIYGSEEKENKATHREIEVKRRNWCVLRWYIRNTAFQNVFLIRGGENFNDFWV